MHPVAAWRHIPVTVPVITAPVLTTLLRLKEKTPASRAVMINGLPASWRYAWQVHSLCVGMVYCKIQLTLGTHNNIHVVVLSLMQSWDYNIYAVQVQKHLACFFLSHSHLLEPCTLHPTQTPITNHPTSASSLFIPLLLLLLLLLLLTKQLPTSNHRWEENHQAERNRHWEQEVAVEEELEYRNHLVFLLKSQKRPS